MFKKKKKKEEQNVNNNDKNKECKKDSQDQIQYIDRDRDPFPWYLDGAHIHLIYYILVIIALGVITYLIEKFFPYI